MKAGDIGGGKKHNSSIMDNHAVQNLYERPGKQDVCSLERKTVKDESLSLAGRNSPTQPVLLKIPIVLYMDRSNKWVSCPRYDSPGNRNTSNFPLASAITQMLSSYKNLLQ